MNKLLSFFFVVLITLAACRDQVKPPRDRYRSLESRFYKRMEGFLGHEKTVMHLHRYGKDITGSYCINGVEYAVQLDTLVTLDSLVLFLNQPGDFYWDKQGKARLQLRWNGKGFSGFYVNANGTERTPVKLEEGYPEGSEKFTVFTFTDTARAFPNRKQPAAIYSLNLLKTDVPWLQKELGMWIDSLSAGNWNLSAKRSAAHYFDQYKQQVVKDGPIIPDRGTDYLNFYRNTTAYILYNQYGFLSVNQFSDEFAGGAHGYYSSTVHNFDLSLKRKLKLQDLVKAGSDALTRLLEAEYRKTRRLPENAKISDHSFVDQIIPTSNFYITDSGISFIYNPYEIASYAEGQIVLTLSYSQLRPYLDVQFAKRMHLVK